MNLQEIKAEAEKIRQQDETLRDKTKEEFIKDFNPEEFVYETLINYFAGRLEVVSEQQNGSSLTAVIQVPINSHRSEAIKAVKKALNHTRLRYSTLVAETLSAVKIDGVTINQAIPWNENSVRMQITYKD